MRFSGDLVCGAAMPLLSGARELPLGKAIAVALSQDPDVHQSKPTPAASTLESLEETIQEPGSL